MNLSRVFIERPIGTALITCGLALAGAIAYLLLPIAPLPQVEFPTISVSASLPGASPDTMAATVATPLERALGSIAGVTEITSSSSLGSARVTLQFDMSREIDGAARDVQAAINASRALLPTGMPSNPTYRKVNPADAPIMIVSLTSDTLTRGQMYDAASTVLAQRLSQVEGVGQVTVGGGALPAVRIELDPNKLSAQGISLEQVRTAVVATNANRPKGMLEDDARYWQIVANDQARQASEYAPLVLGYKDGAAVRLRDVADVVDSVQDLRNDGLANGKSAVLLILNKAPGANIIKTVDTVRGLLPQLRASISPSIDVNVVMDRTTTIRASIVEVQRTLAISFGLVIVVVFIFLRRLRAALLPAVAVPVSLAGTFGAMYLLGYSVDNLSLMAMTVATGFVVDDAIVVLENISRHIERGVPPREAALRGAKEIGFTVVSISLSLIAVFIPILAMGGIVGRLFREFAVVLSVAILVSMVVSLTTTPMMAATLLRPQAEARSPGRWSRAMARLGRSLARGYRRSLRWTLRHQPVALAVLAGVVALNVFLYVTIPKGFFPQQDTGLMMGGVQADQASSFQSMQLKLRTFHDIVRADPAVANVTGFTGGGQRNSANMFISLKPQAERRESIDAVINRLRGKLAKVPGANLFLAPVQDIRVGGRQSNAAWQYTLQADDLADLRTWEPRIRRALTEVPFITDVNTDQQDKGTQTSLVVDRDALARLGITMSAFDSTLNNAFGQRQVGVIYNPLNQYRVVMELAPQWLQSPQTLDRLMLTSSGGEQVPLSSVARVETTSTPLSVSHQSGTPASTISFNLAEGVSLSDAVTAVNDAVAGTGAPVSVRGSFQGTAQVFQASLKSQPLLILAAVVTIYLVLGILYESLIHPITILSTLPSAGVGALLALMACKTEFSIIALIGVILLIGIVKKNAIMMLDFALSARREAEAGGRWLGSGAVDGRAAAAATHPDDDRGRHLRRRAAGARPRRGRRAARAAGHRHRRWPAAEPGLDPLHHARRVLLHGPAQPPQACSARAVRAAARAHRSRPALTAMPKTALTPLLLAALLAGCAVTSQHPPAEPAPPAAFKGSTDWQRAPADVAVPEAWWTLFDDPVLNELQARLVVGNQNLAAALAQVDSARAVLRASHASIFPTLSLGAGTTRSATGASSGVQRSVATNSSLTANAAWEIDLWGRLAEGIKAAGASYQASQADLAALRLSVQATLTQTYLALRTAEAQQALLVRTEAANQRALDLTQARYEGGVVAQTDVLQARTQLRNVQTQLSDMRTQRALLEHAIAVLLGQMPSEFRLADSVRTPALPPVPELLPSTLLAQRPDIAAARARQVAAYAQIGIADAAFFPSVDLSASAGYRGASWSNLVSAPNLLWSIGAAVAAPLFDGGQRRLASDQARASADAATANYRQVVLTAFQEVEDNLVVFAESGESLALQRDAYEAAQRNLDIVLDQYRAGTVSFLNVSAAQSSLLSAESSLLASRNRQLAAASVLLKNLGGRLPPA
jgi:multidrug efflux pump